MTTRQQNRLDRLISEIGRRRCSGLQINITDLSKVSQAGYAAAQSGGNAAAIESAVVDTYQRLRQN